MNSMTESKIKVYSWELIKLPNGRFRIYYDDASAGIAYFASEVGFKTKRQANLWALDNLENIAKEKAQAEGK